MYIKLIVKVTDSFYSTKITQYQAKSDTLTRNIVLNSHGKQIILSFIGLIHIAVTLFSRLPRLPRPWLPPMAYNSPVYITQAPVCNLVHSELENIWQASHNTINLQLRCSTKQIQGDPLFVMTLNGHGIWRFCVKRVLKPGFDFRLAVLRIESVRSSGVFHCWSSKCKLNSSNTIQCSTLLLRTAPSAVVLWDPVKTFHNNWLIIPARIWSCFL